MDKIITNIHHYKTEEKEIYTAKIRYKNKTLNITYNCLNQMVSICEWYILNPLELKKISYFIVKKFKHYVNE